MVKKIVSVIFAIILVFVIKNYSNAASATIQCSDIIDVGTPILISVNGSGVQWSLKLKVNGQQIASNSEFENVEGNKSIAFSGNYTPTSEGTLTVTLEGSVTEASDGSTIKNFASKTITVKAKEQQNEGGGNTGNSNQSGQTNPGGQPATPEKSKVATLSNLGIRPNDFSGFKPNTYSYTTEVPNDVEKIEVYASKGHSGQTISGTGTNKTLKVGENKFNVTVTAEDGKTTKTYTINVIRKEAEVKPNQEEPNENEPDKNESDEETNEKPEEPEEAFGLSELTIEGLKLKPQFKTDVYEYTLELKEDLEKLNITALSTHADTNIEITGNENLVEGENVITIIVKIVDKENGIYDKIATYQIVVNKITSKEVVEDNSKQDKMEKIIIVSTAGGAILIIILIFVIAKIRKQKRVYDDEYNTYNDIGNYEEKTMETKEIVEDKPDDNEFYEEIKKIKSKGKRFK
ncbi:MAG: cadherin-like beta sandwich domain-containing protein [Clostridia bacterium]|nr:cadherin-like beta sandwich domain-containing protein [Clostridia bacterium]